MKVIFKDYAYAQREDIFYLKKIGFNIPDSIFENAFNNIDKNICPKNRFDFVKFINKEEIEFLESCDLIPEYVQMNRMSSTEIVQLFEQYQREKNEKVKLYKSMTTKEKNENSHIITGCKELNIKMDFLKDVLLYKQGHVKFEIPEEIRELERRENNGVKKLFKSVFKKYGK